MTVYIQKHTKTHTQIINPLTLSFTHTHHKNVVLVYTYT